MTWGECMQNFHKENNIAFVEGNISIGPYFGIFMYTFMKMVHSKGLNVTTFYIFIKCKISKSFKG